MIRIATAECFTHGIVGKELHSFNQGYPSIISSDFFRSPEDISVVCSLFIPTFQALTNILKVDAPQPFETIHGIKVYKEKEDLEVALLMAESVRKISNADIGIGTTAGIGRGGIAVVTQRFTISTTSDVFADLRSSSPAKIMLRQKSGIQKAFKILKKILEGEINEKENNEFNLKFK
jgi:uncharacterized protein (UPF0254 family)